MELVRKMPSNLARKTFCHFFFSTLIISMFLVSPVAAQSTGQSPKVFRAADRPPPSEKATEVTLGMYLLDVLAINDSQQTITIDLGVSMQWVDSRLADRVGEIIPLEEVWNPRLELVANKSIRLTKPKVLRVGEGGSVQYLQRYIGEIWHASELARFPFDNQEFSIQMLSPRHTPDELVLIEDKARTGQSGDWSIFGWEASEGGWKKDPYDFGPSHELFAGASYTFPVHRKQGFYLWKVIVPISLVLLMSAAAFWIDPSNSGSQISVAYTAILTLVAYRFLISKMVPAVSYLTLLDRFILGASVLAVCVLIESIWTGRLTAQGQMAKSIRIDYYSRWVFMGGYILVLVVSFVV